MLRYFVSNFLDPYRNLAMEQVIMNNVPTDYSILFLWQNDNTIVVGRNQDAYAECKVEEFINSGGKIARRRSGGGAVYHDKGNLNFSIIGYETQVKGYSYQEIVNNALQRFGINTEFNGRNDLLIDNRKFSGNAFLVESGIACQHGTILISSDLEKMAYFLTPDISKLKRNHVNSVSSRVVNLNSVSKDISVAGMRNVLIKANDAREFELSPNEEEIERIEQFYKNPQWIFGGKR